MSELFVAVQGDFRGEDGPGKTVMILNPDFSFMKDQLAAVFGKNADFKILIDRRKRTSDRRKARSPVAVERRGADRRQGPKRCIAEVIFGV